MTSNVDAIRAFSNFLNIATNAGNMAAYPDVFANGYGPIVRQTAEGRELAECRWGMPSSEEAIGNKNYDNGTTNIRRTFLPHWKPWLDIESRCVVPANSFCEPDQVGKTYKNIWFALDESRPLFFFAGIWTPQWTSVRMVREGTTTSDLYGFLTTAANQEVAQYHDKAMPVILRTPEEVEQWFSLPVKDIKDFQKAKKLPDGSLKVVSSGLKWDPPEATPRHPRVERAPKAAAPPPAAEPKAQQDLF